MKRNFKIILDVIMLLMMLTLFSKSLISMKYHEIAGIVLIILIIVHIVINIKTITAMGKKFAKVPAGIKTGFIVDILLIICFAWLGISGVLISHTILTGISSINMLFKMSHIFAGGASVILLGVHIGLHICQKPMPVVTALIISAVVFCAGIYGVINSSEVRWLSIPFTSASHSMGEGNHQGNMPDGQEQNSNPQNRKNMQDGNRPDGQEQNSKQNMSDGKYQGNMPNENTPAGNGGQMKRQPMSVFQKVQNIIMFLGMILSCTMITYWIAVPKKKKLLQLIQKIDK